MVGTSGARPTARCLPGPELISQLICALPAVLGRNLILQPGTDDAGAPPHACGRYGPQLEQNLTGKVRQPIPGGLFPASTPVARARENEISDAVRDQEAVAARGSTVRGAFGR